MSSHNRPLDLTIRPGDLVKTSTLSSSTLYARPFGTQDGIVSLPVGIILLVVRGPARPPLAIVSDQRAYTLNVLLGGQMFEVLLDDVERVDDVIPCL